MSRSNFIDLPPALAHFKPTFSIWTLNFRKRQGRRKLLPRILLLNIFLPLKPLRFCTPWTYSFELAKQNEM